HASLRYGKFLWQAGDTFTGHVFVNDDLAEGSDRVSAAASLPGVTLAGNTISFPIPEGVDSFTVTLTLEKDGVVDRTDYLFLVGTVGSTPIAPVVDFVRSYRN
ncbi:MAG: hypothetical protein IKU11_01225, partial [Clostridia bacterium]|nr:hypothetical protein [Clostridia bacterium]